MDLRPVLIIVPTLLFAYMNGANDSGTMAASVVSSRTLAPRRALFIAGIASFLGALFLGSAVARTLGEGLVLMQQLPADARPFVACVAAAFSAIAWGFFAWKFGLPASYTHALLGGWLGGFAALGGLTIINVGSVTSVLAAVLLTPFLALIIAWISMRILYAAVEECGPSWMSFFRGLESLMFGAMSFAHGANAAQKSMALLVIAGLTINQTGAVPLEFDLPFWVQGLCAGAFSLGVLLGFTRTLKTVGFGIFHVGPLHSVCALASAGGLTLVSTLFGLPLSSGQINSSSLLGAGAGHNMRAVRWDVAVEFLANWVMTFPATAFMAYIFVKVLK